MPKKRFSAEQIVTLLRQIEVSMAQGKSIGSSCREAGISEPKTDKTRAVTLPAFAVVALRGLKRQQAEELLALGVRQTAQTLACARADGEPHQPRSLSHEFARLMGRMKDVPRIRFHDLRHSHATQLLLAGVHPKLAQERLGHSTISTTLDLYSHVTATMQQDAATQLDKVFQAAMRGGDSTK